LTIRETGVYLVYD
jgi:hypothetical protein